MATGLGTTGPGATDRPGAPPLERPDGRRRGFGPFVTLVESELPGGIESRWESRRQRKHWAQARRVEGTWWAPLARGWWIGVLFAIGSTLFAIGAVPGYAGTVGIRADSVTFFAGSLFFTAAALLQYRESVDAANGGPPRGRRRVLSAFPDRIDWWASGVQLVGTLYFNVSTGMATNTDLSVTAARQHVWRPDAIGSICFLVASGLAWFEVSHGWWSWSPHRVDWWITALNLTGSVAFGVSAVAAAIVPSTGELRNAQLSNLGTFAGAVCFLVGAVLLLPERTATGP